MQIQLEISETLYAEFAQAAAASGQSVEVAMVDQLAAKFDDDLPDGFWSPERLAELRAADAEIDAGDFFTAEQVREHFAQKKAAWIQSQRP